LPRTYYSEGAQADFGGHFFTIVNQDFDPREMLGNAREKAQRLVDDLLRQQSQLREPSATIDALALAEGQEALTRAIAAARALLAAIEASPASDTQDPRL
jgi:hypothetical protein